MTRSALPNLPAFAAVAGGILSVAFTYAFMLTHDASGSNDHLRLFGFTYLDVARSAVIWQALVLVGLGGLHRTQASSLGRFGRLALFPAATGLALVLAGQVSYNWIVDPHLDFESAWVQVGWLMRVYGAFLGIVGMAAYGVASWRSGGLGPWRWLPAANAMALALWLVLEVVWIPTLPERSDYREVRTAASAMPYALTWILAGVAIRRVPRAVFAGAPGGSLSGPRPLRS